MYTRTASKMLSALDQVNTWFFKIMMVLLLVAYAYAGMRG